MQKKQLFQTVSQNLISLMFLINFQFINDLKRLADLKRKMDEFDELGKGLNYFSPGK
ncbi:hypothetical protein [Pedobacter polysacchareus]|uniref:hypothetical protein n=1 Tax=Pedobacter polysacchareus TaxID=2861973 RepID=UPI001C993E66|nr:hypothetical protein [Pedobacter polysacchareus]